MNFSSFCTHPPYQRNSNITFSSFLKTFFLESFYSLHHTIYLAIHFILERWPSLVRHRTRNPASGLCSHAGSNPVLSLKSPIHQEKTSLPRLFIDINFP